MQSYSDIAVKFEGTRMYLIKDVENNQYYSAVFETRDEALDAIEDLCYHEQMDSDYFTVVTFKAA